MYSPLFRCKAGPVGGARPDVLSKLEGCNPGLTCYPKVVARGPGSVFYDGRRAGPGILCGTQVGCWWAQVASVVTAGPAWPPTAESESAEYCPARGRFWLAKDLCEAAGAGIDSEMGQSGSARPRPLLEVVPP